MFIEFKNIYVPFNEVYPLAYLYLGRYESKSFLESVGKSNAGSYSSFSTFIAVIDNVPQRFADKFSFEDYRILDESEEKDMFDLLKRCNLTINDKGNFSFVDYSKINFEIDGNVLTYDEFCKYELPSGQVFKLVYDNGFSYIGSDPFRGNAKEYADAAIRVAEKIKYLWVGWRFGFRLTKYFDISAVYGKNERYSEVSFT